MLSHYFSTHPLFSIHFNYQSNSFINPSLTNYPLVTYPPLIHSSSLSPKTLSAYQTSDKQHDSSWYLLFQLWNFMEKSLSYWWCFSVMPDSKYLCNLLHGQHRTKVTHWMSTAGESPPPCPRMSTAGSRHHPISSNLLILQNLLHLCIPRPYSLFYKS